MDIESRTGRAAQELHRGRTGPSAATSRRRARLQTTIIPTRWRGGVIDSRRRLLRVGWQRGIGSVPSTGARCTGKSGHRVASLLVPLGCTVGKLPVDLGPSLQAKDPHGAVVRGLSWRDRKGASDRCTPRLLPRLWSPFGANGFGMRRSTAVGPSVGVSVAGPRAMSWRGHREGARTATPVPQTQAARLRLDGVRELLAGDWFVGDDYPFFLPTAWCPCEPLASLESSASPPVGADRTGVVS